MSITMRGLRSFFPFPVTIRLTLYIDQAIIRAANKGIIQRDGIDNTVSSSPPDPSEETPSNKISSPANCLPSVVLSFGVRQDNDVLVDVHRGPISAQRGHGDGFPGTISTHALRNSRLGISIHSHRHLGGHYDQVQSQSRVS